MTTEEVSSLIGRAGDIRIMEVEKGAIRKLADAVDDGNPRLPLKHWFQTGLRKISCIAPFSYTLYVVHFPIMSVISAIWLAGHEILPPRPWVTLGSIVLIILVSMALAEFCEKPFMAGGRFRKALLR